MPVHLVPSSSSSSRTGISRTPWRRLSAGLAVAALAVTGLATGTAPALAAGATGAAFTGGAGTFAGATMFYAKQNAALILTVTADAGTTCVQVSGPAGSFQTSAVAKTSWTFPFTGGSGDGLQSYVVSGYTKSNNNGCNGNGTSLGTASYTLDNTAPTAAPALSPSANGAGWNNANVNLAWTASDGAGSGVKTVSPATESITANGITTRSTTLTDNLGNVGTSSVTVRVDKAAPTITGSRTPGANADGWNNTDVTVSFSASDPSGSGVKTVTGPTVLTASAANQSVTGAAVDNADNTASTTVSGINIDKTAPTLSGKATTNPNSAGWYNGDVTVAWTAIDGLSGTTNPANTVINGEGTALTSSTTATDKAGNSTSAQSAAVKIDRTAPTTTVTAPPAWNKSDVTLTLVPKDSLSGVDKTYYSLDGGPQTPGTSVPVTAEGNHTLAFWSTDLAGNTEARQTVSFGIDKTSPAIGHTQNPAANADGWNNGTVIVTFACSDALSGVASCTGPQTVTTEGRTQAVTGTVTDTAGNTASDPATVSIDKTKPVVTVDALPAPNANGWYSTDVTATFTASDALSGVKTQDKAHTFGEGAAQTFTATATDGAGNSATATTPAVNVDQTAPTITGQVTSSPNGAGWYTGDVTVHWTCADTLSGVVACPADSVVTGEGSAGSASASVMDKAGNTATATMAGIKIDRSKPTTTATGVPTGWVNAAVTVGLHATDNLSDVAATYYTVDEATTPAKGSTVTIGAQGLHTVSYWSVDGAGNTEDAQTFSVKLDLTSPTILPSQAPAQNTHGWNNTDVTVSFACADQTDLSGLKACSAPATVTSEGTAQSVTGTATDNAGNSVTGTATVNIDKTAPTITASADRQANEAHWYNADVTVAFTAKDDRSGVDTVTAPVHLGEGADQHADGIATDNAGNTGTTSLTGINVDQTAPNLSAAPTQAPNANGWYNTSVTQVWSADDALSGLADDKPADAVLTAEGAAQTVSASVSDNAGNTTTARSAPVNIDRTPPTTTATAPDGWVNDSVTVVLKGSDPLSQVARTEYAVDGGSGVLTFTPGTSVTLTTEGTHDVAFHSIDKAGNVEATQHVLVKIDKTAPTITHVLSPTANDAGWNNADVTVTFTCVDQEGLSGVASCTSPQTVTTEAKDNLVTGNAKDVAGNSADDVVTVKLDKTKPTIAGSRSPAANGYGWNNTPVMVHFASADTLSGVASTTPDVSVGEGTNVSVPGQVVDAAGNSAETTVTGINVDMTAPTLSGAPKGDANGAGWYKGNVTVGWTSGDDRSGVALNPADSVITGEGTGLFATATAFDKAGNSTTADSAKVSIDRTSPVTGANAPEGWNNSAVSVSLAPNDGLSGVAATYYTVDGGAQQQGTALSIANEGMHALKYWSVDAAGNVEAAHTVTVKIDLTKPTIGHTVAPAPNGKGWNNTPVTVSYACADALSGVAACSDAVTVSIDGADQAVPGSAVDSAGNTQNDPATVSIDTVKPTISATPDRAPNSNRWYAGDVTISYACNDTLSGVATCSSPTKVGEGAAQTASGTAVDVAGNSAVATVSPINVDKTAPTLKGAARTAPNAAGWYRGDVTIAWTAGDALSGIDGTAPTDSVLTGEGTALTASTSVSDLAGNETSATSAPVKIDRTAPKTTVSDISDWTNTDVTVALTASDNLSEVAATYYQLDTAPATTGTRVIIGSEGVHTLQVWSVDKAGNVEEQKNLEVKIDKTAPSISHTQSPAANARGWTKADVTVTFTCTDTLSRVNSGIASCPAPVTKGEGGAQQVSGTATDKAGNTATDTTSVNVDKTKPTVAGSLSASANGYGWFNADVDATFTCADQAGLSGVLSCPATKTLGEGKNQSAGGTATDAADNVSNLFSITGINVDETAPTLGGAVTTQPNANGWYQGDVTVHWTASDALSGLNGTVPADSTVKGEGAALSVSTAVSDQAGNTTSATVGGLKIDRTAPSTGANPPSGWQSKDVTLSLTATDNLSGVAVTHYAVDGLATQDGTTVTIGSEGTHTVSFWSVDQAGNSEQSHAVTVLGAKTAPTITGAPTTQPNANGWYNAPVTVHFTCGDALSGMASCQPNVGVSTEGVTNSVTGTAVDNAGNTSTTTVGPIRVDTVAPVVTVGGVKDGGQYTLGAVPAATATATDATSGLASPATGVTTGGLANGVGTFTYTASATDKAGNTSTVVVHYTVVYGLGTTLFLQPVNDTAHQTGLSTSVFNAGQTIPMKFQVKNAAGQVVQTNTAPKWLAPVKGGATSAAVNEDAYSASATTGATYTWDATGQQYQYNWKTDKSMVGYYWRVGVTLDDGMTYYVNVGLR